MFAWTLKFEYPGTRASQLKILAMPEYSQKD